MVALSFFCGAFKGLPSWIAEVCKITKHWGSCWRCTCKLGGQINPSIVSVSAFIQSLLLCTDHQLLHHQGANGTTNWGTNHHRMKSWSTISRLISHPRIASGDSHTAVTAGHCWFAVISFIYKSGCSFPHCLREQLFLTAPLMVTSALWTYLSASAPLQSA